VHGDLLWSRPTDAWERTRLGRFLHRIDPGLERYEDAWRWSIAELDQFWQAVWDEFDIRATTQPESVLADRRMPGAVWFPGMRLNYAEHSLRWTGDDVAVHVFVEFARARG
jgi:acetoacetyl-CoA synthetase